VSTVVHAGYGRNGLAFAEISHADLRLGAIRNSKGSRVRRLDYPWQRASGISGVPKDVTRGGELLGDLEL
jgi:hypothetical protein